MAKIRKKRKKDILLEQGVIADEQTPQTDITTSEQTSTNDVEQVVTQLADQVTVAPKKRIWEVDFLRGFMILFVVWDHFMWDLRYGFGGDYQTGFFQWLYKLSASYYSGQPNSLRNITHDTFVSLFVFTSGLSCSFSKSNGKRAIKMICFALLLSAVTFAVTSIVGDNVTVNFNVIHVIALSVLLWTGIEWLFAKLKPAWAQNLLGWLMVAIIVTVLIVGYSAKAVPWTKGSKIWFFLAQHSHSMEGFTEFWGGDYLPFFPDFAWFLVGGFLGKKLYKNRETLFPTFNAKWVSPFTFCGRYSIWVYFGSQVFMFLFFYLFHGLWNIL